MFVKNIKRDKTMKRIIDIIVVFIIASFLTAFIGLGVYGCMLIDMKNGYFTTTIEEYDK